MPNLAQSHVQEIGAAPVGALLSMTVNAVVDAQAASSLKTAQLFEQFAYDIDLSDPNNPVRNLRYLDMTYMRANPDFDPDQPAGGTNVPSLKHTVRMPEILMNPPKPICFKEAKFDFNVKIDSMEYQKQETTNNFSASLGFRARLGWWGNLNLQSSFSHKSKKESGQEVNRHYALGVSATLEADGLSPGMEMMMGIFQKAILENSAAVPPAS